ncbi:hypothetical protein [Psychrobacter piscatorii]
MNFLQIFYLALPMTVLAKTTVQAKNVGLTNNVVLLPIYTELTFAVCVE